MDYLIGELADLLGVTRKTLRHYEARGLLQPGRAENGYRLYTEGDRERAERILRLQALGLSLAQVERVLDGDDDTLRDVLLEALADTDAEIDALEAQRHRLEEALSGEAIEMSLPIGLVAALIDPVHQAEDLLSYASYRH